MKALLISFIFVVGSSAVARTIESFTCTATYAISPSKTVTLSYPWGPSGEKPVIYCDATDGYWHSCASSYDLGEFIDNGAVVLFGGPNLNRKNNALRIETNTLDGSARLCEYNSGPFATAACYSYLDVAGTAKCSVTWK